MRERRTLAAAGEALLGSPVRESHIAGVEPLIARLRPLDRLQLRALLVLLDRGAPLLTGRLLRFADLPLETRERTLRAWADSALPVRRRAVVALKTLSALAYYGSENSWGDVGYDGPWLGRVPVRVLSAPSSRRSGSGEPIAASGSAAASAYAAGRIHGCELTSDLRLRVQACVIGTGAGGAAALARLAQLGVDAVAVEAGAWVTETHFTQRTLEMLPLLYEEAGLRATRDKAIGILQGRGLGGSTLHNTGLVYEPPPAIIARWRAEHGFDIADNDLDRLVRRAFAALGAVRIPDDRINANNAALRRGADALGWRYRVAHHNRVECSGCGYCMIGCAYNRKSNAALTWIPMAVDAGARILTHARAERIEGSPGRRRVVCRLAGPDGRPSGRHAVMEAEIVLVATGALETPALLRRSGLGGPLVGRGLRLHPSAVIGAVFPERVEAWRGLPQSVVLEEFASFMETGRDGFVVIASASTPALSAAVVPGLGHEHRARMLELPRAALAAVVLHDETRGTVRADRRGRPLASYWPDRPDLAELRRGIAALARLYFAAGAERVVLPYADAPDVRSEAELTTALDRARDTPHRLSLNSVHPQGSCPIAPESGRGPCRPDGRLWSEPDVYVCDTSLFPTSVGVPPQVTAMAMALMVAERAGKAV